MRSFCAIVFLATILATAWGRRHKIPWVVLRGGSSGYPQGPGPSEGPHDNNINSMNYNQPPPPQEGNFDNTYYSTPPELPGAENDNMESPNNRGPHQYRTDPPPLPPGYGPQSQGDPNANFPPPPPPGFTSDGYPGDSMVDSPDSNEPWGESSTQNEDAVDMSSFDKEYILKGLARIYRKKILPLEIASRYGHFHSPPLSPADFIAPPMVLLLGQYRYVHIMFEHDCATFV